MLGRGAHRQPLVLLVEAVLLAVAALAYALGQPRLAIAAIVLAMGLENAVFQIDGGAGLGLTYVTGALVKVGQLLAAALTGGARWAWVPNLLLWAALVAGSVCGALAYHWINLAAIWFAAAAALALSGDRRRDRASTALTANARLGRFDGHDQETKPPRRVPDRLAGGAFALAADPSLLAAHARHRRRLRHRGRAAGRI